MPKAVYVGFACSSEAAASTSITHDARRSTPASQAAQAWPGSSFGAGLSSAASANGADQLIDTLSNLADTRKFLSPARPEANVASLAVTVANNVPPVVLNWAVRLEPEPCSDTL